MKSIKSKNHARLKVGDQVMVIAGGNKNKRPNKGKVGRIMRFVGDNKDRVVVEGVNLFWDVKRATMPGQETERSKKEVSIHVSNVMYYAEKLEAPVKLRSKFLNDGTKVRGYIDPQSNEFVQA